MEPDSLVVPLINPVKLGWIRLRRPIDGTSEGCERRKVDKMAGGDGMDTGLLGGGVGAVLVMFCPTCCKTGVGVGVLEVWGGVELLFGWDDTAVICAFVCPGISDLPLKFWKSKISHFLYENYQPTGDVTLGPGETLDCLESGRWLELLGHDPVLPADIPWDDTPFWTVLFTTVLFKITPESMINHFYSNYYTI